MCHEKVIKDVLTLLVARVGVKYGFLIKLAMLRSPHRDKLKTKGRHYSGRETKACRLPNILGEDGPPYRLIPSILPSGISLYRVFRSTRLTNQMPPLFNPMRLVVAASLSP